jgi:glycerol-3-phosphate acyltransferase PlsY
VLSLATAGLLGYLIGSLPTAYLLVKWKSRIDIREEGSGNVGTLNSMQVTRSRAVGATVLLLDVLKGVAAIMCVRSVVSPDFPAIAVAGVAAVGGHNFPVWLGFRGGRGLATAAGILLVLAWLTVAVWGLFWFVGFRIARDVNVGNALACVMTMVVVLTAPSDVMLQVGPGGVTPGAFSWFMAPLLGVILTRHVEPLREYVRMKRSPGRKTTAEVQRDK